MRLPGINYNAGNVPRARRIDAEMPMEHARRMMQHEQRKASIAMKTAGVAGQAAQDAYKGARDAIILGNNMSLQKSQEQIENWGRVFSVVGQSLVQAGQAWWQAKQEKKVNDAEIQTARDYAQIDTQAAGTRGYLGSEMPESYQGPRTEKRYDPVAGRVLEEDVVLQPHEAQPDVTLQKRLSVIETNAEIITDPILQDRFIRKHTIAAINQYTADQQNALKNQQTEIQASLQFQQNLAEEQGDFPLALNILDKRGISNEEKKLERFRIQKAAEKGFYKNIVNESSRTDGGLDAVKARAAVLDAAIQELADTENYNGNLTPAERDTQITEMRTARKRLGDFSAGASKALVADELDNTRSMLELYTNGITRNLTNLETQYRKLLTLGVEKDNRVMVDIRNTLDASPYLNEAATVPADRVDSYIIELGLEADRNPDRSGIVEQQINIARRVALERKEDNLAVARRYQQVPNIPFQPFVRDENGQMVPNQGAFATAAQNAEVGQQITATKMDLLTDEEALRTNQMINNMPPDEKLAFFSHAISELKPNQYYKLMDQLGRKDNAKGYYYAANLFPTNETLAENIVAGMYQRTRPDSTLPMPSMKDLNYEIADELAGYGLLNPHERDGVIEAAINLYAFNVMHENLSPDFPDTGTVESVVSSLFGGSVPEFKNTYYRKAREDWSADKHNDYFYNVDAGFISELGGAVGIDNETLARKFQSGQFVLQDTDTKGVYALRENNINGEFLTSNNGGPFLINFDHLVNYVQSGISTPDVYIDEERIYETERESRIGQ